MDRQVLFISLYGIHILIRKLYRFKLYASSMLKICCHGRDCMIVGFITTYAISAYHH